MSQNFPRVTKFGYLLRENVFKKMSFMSRIVLLDPKLNPSVNFSNSRAEEKFSFSLIFGMSRREKSSRNPPD